MVNSIAHFWVIYIEKSRAYGLKEHVIRWYVIRAEAYIKAHRDIKLKSHSAQLVTAYLQTIGGRVLSRTSTVTKHLISN